MENNYIDNINCECIDNVVALCGGGLTAVIYCCGSLYGLHKKSKLVEKKPGATEYTPCKDTVFVSSSGGTIPLLMLHCCIANNLHNSREDWFEHYIIGSIEKLKTETVIKLMPSAMIKSFLIYNRLLPDVIRDISKFIDNTITEIMHPDMLTGAPLCFSDNNRYLYNYIIDTYDNSFPEVSNDFTHINNYSRRNQLFEILIACTVPVSVSYSKTGIINDAALMVDNDIIKLDQYLNLKNVYYYTITAYDEKTNNQYNESIFDLFGIMDRFSRIHNYRAINNIKMFCMRSDKNVKFNLITIPNKFDPVLKYDNKIYSELVPYLFFQNDFSNVVRYVGLYSEPFNKLLLLLGVYETLYALDDKTEYNSITNYLDASYDDVLKDPYYIYKQNQTFIPNIWMCMMNKFGLPF